MSVRQREEKCPKTGRVRKQWMIDITYHPAVGSPMRVRKNSPRNTREGALEYERQVRDALLRGVYGRKEEKHQEPPTFKAFAEEFLGGYAKTNNRPSTVDEKTITLRKYLVPHFGATRLDHITARDIERLKSALAGRQLKPKTINNHLGVLRGLLNKALEWELIERAPKVQMMRLDPQTFDFLQPDEAVRLVEAAEREHGWRASILLALRTGLRRGELLALRWDDVDLKSRRLVVRRSSTRGRVGPPKSGKHREIPLSDDTLAVLVEHRHLRSELVFCQPDGSPWRDHHLRPPLTRACKRAGLRVVGWHVLRHSFASHLTMAGVPPRAIQELLGHSSIGVTMRYSHLSPHVSREAVDRLDAMSRGTRAARSGRSESETATNRP